MNSKGIQVLTGAVWPITLLQFEMLLFPVAGSSLLAVLGVTTAKSAEGNICLHLSCFHTTSSVNPSSVTAQDETLTFPQSSWWSSSSTASVLGMVIRGTPQWIRDFHLSYWPCSSDAQHPEMKKKKKIRKNFVQLTVWRAPEINLEAAKPAETTFLTRSTAESWPDTEPAEVSEKLQSNPMAHGQVWLWQSPGQRDDAQSCLSTDTGPWVICVCIATQPTWALPQNIGFG